MTAVWLIKWSVAQNRLLAMTRTVATTDNLTSCAVRIVAGRNIWLSLPTSLLHLFGFKQALVTRNINLCVYIIWNVFIFMSTRVSRPCNNNIKANKMHHAVCFTARTRFNNYWRNSDISFLHHAKNIAWDFKPTNYTRALSSSTWSILSCWQWQ